MSCDCDGWSTWMRPDAESLWYPRSLNSCFKAFSLGSRFLLLVLERPVQNPEPSVPGSEELQKPKAVEIQDPAAKSIAHSMMMSVEEEVRRSSLVAATLRYIPFQSVCKCNCCRKGDSYDDEAGHIDLDRIHFPADANARHHFTHAAEDADYRANPYAAARPMHANAYPGAGEPGLDPQDGEGGAHGGMTRHGNGNPFERARAPPSDYGRTRDAARAPQTEYRTERESQQPDLPSSRSVGRAPAEEEAESQRQRR
ncbi:hypothetical protein C8R47DRAFT_1324842 [Mycena vitilis]|nr:hypothetical protein C8R47DRAFT_1324842 [Mycena vitilis]